MSRARTIFIQKNTSSPCNFPSQQKRQYAGHPASEAELALCASPSDLNAAHKTREKPGVREACAERMSESPPVIALCIAVPLRLKYLHAPGTQLRPLR